MVQASLQDAFSLRHHPALKRPAIVRCASGATVLYLRFEYEDTLFIGSGFTEAGFRGPGRARHADARPTAEGNCPRR